MSQTSRLVQGVLLAGALTLTLTACGQKQLLVGGAAPQSTSQVTSPAVPTPQPTPTASPQSTQAPLHEKKVKAYYSDPDEMKLVEKEVTVSYKQDSGMYEAAFNALKSSHDANAVSLFDDMAFTSVKLDAAKGELHIDMKFGPKTQLGAPGEDLFLQALKKTAFQFPEVKTLYVLKDGKQVESLMGHLELPYPIKRPN